MVVMVLERVPASLRGELTRWMQEVQAGVFVGSLSAMVRDLLWKKSMEKRADGWCCQIYSTNTEQGYAIRVAGDAKRNVIDVEGILLIAVKNARWERVALASYRTDKVIDK